MATTLRDLQARLAPHGQQHLLSFWEQLDRGQRDRLAEQLAAVDFDLMARLFRGDDDSPNWDELAARPEPPRAVSLAGQGRPFTPAQATLRGEEALRNGRVGLILVAGGQGTRLGFDHPKGMLPLGPLSKRTLFEILFDRVRAMADHYGTRIPLYLMTSPATHGETTAYLAEHNKLGMDDQDVRVFCQGVMPAVDSETGKVLLESPGSLFLSPDGHGGMLAALDGSGCLNEMRERGLQHLCYGQVDNPLLQICDPQLVGHHLLAESEMTTQVVRKQDPLDRVGNVAIIDGQMQIIEYSDLPDSVARQRNPDGSLRLWAGSIAVHVFDVGFLERMAGQDDQLPFHRARKKAGYVDHDGRLVTPSSPNAIKFERFIFDLLPAAANSIVVEAAAEDAFAAVKNAAGAADETVETAQQAMIRRDLKLLQAAGVFAAEGVPVEVNPRWALDAAEVREHLSPGYCVTGPTYFRE